MTEIESRLQYEYIKSNNRLAAVNLHSKNGPFAVIHNIVIHTDDRFQRIYVYENGIIASEEIYGDKTILRFNRPFTEDEHGTLSFDE
ncbi:hypothetical protein CN966_30525 [Bacillus cereus]|nr:hypothetical protein IC7_02977 [Bacillus cereus BAG1O-1]PGN48207.1 hypothetical protein CN966_30525 [Bacillus cereus]